MFELNAENAASYLQRPCTATALGGGVSNTVLLIESDDQRFVLKQSLPKLRVEQDWYSDRERIFRESSGLRWAGKFLPHGAVPQVLFEDRSNFLFAMTAGPSRAETWKTQLLQGCVYEDVAATIGEMLGRIICATCRSAELEAEFGDQTVFDQLRIDPYYRTAASRHPDLARQFDELIRDSAQRRFSLVHGDWSPKNFLITGHTVLAIDFEVIHYGDPSFDAAFLLNHLLLKGFYQPQFENRYHTAARVFWQALRANLPADADWFEMAAIRHLGALMLARVDGKSPAEYIQDAALKEKVRQFARQLLLAAPESIDAVYRR